jgi:predicted dehydrogenase
MDKLKFGMIGGGKGSFIGDLHLKGALFDHLGLLKAGCFSRNYNKSLEFGAKMNIDPNRIYKSYGEMAEKEAIRDDKIDFVIIAAPNNVHYDCAKTFLEHGINVVCDKPLTYYSYEAENLMHIAREKDLLFGVTYVYTAYPAVPFMRNIIDSGKLGNLNIIKAEYLTDNLAVDNEQLGNSMLWRIDPKFVGRSTCCGDIGVHAQNLISTLTGLKIDELSADLNIYGNNRVLDTNFTAIVRYKGGVKGHIWCSNVAVGHCNGLSISIYGDKGSLRWELENPDIVIFSELSGTDTHYHMGTTFSSIGDSDIFRLPAGVSEGYYEAFANIYKKYMTALLNKKSGLDYTIDYPDVSAGVESIRFLEACLSSSENNGVWTKL